MNFVVSLIALWKKKTVKLIFLINLVKSGFFLYSTNTDSFLFCVRNGKTLNPPEWLFSWIHLIKLEIIRFSTVTLVVLIYLNSIGKSQLDPISFFSATYRAKWRTNYFNWNINWKDFMLNYSITFKKWAMEFWAK